MQTLVNNRREVLDIVIKQLMKERPTVNWTAAMLTQKINEWSNKEQDSKYKPYCQIVIYHLKKKLLTLHNIHS